MEANASLALKVVTGSFLKEKVPYFWTVSDSHTFFLFCLPIFHICSLYTDRNLKESYTTMKHNTTKAVILLFAHSRNANRSDSHTSNV